MKLYKALKPDMTSFYDGKTKWKLKQWQPKIETKDEGPCGAGYHLAKSINDCMRYAEFPVRIFTAEGQDKLGEDETKIRLASARILTEVKKPAWIEDVNDFLDEIKETKWFAAKKPPKKEWKLFDTRVAARDAARDAALVAARDAACDAACDATLVAARDAARDAAWDAARVAARDAARDAALMARVKICNGLKLDKKHVKHAEDRWEVWEMGYGLLCDIDGVLYVYRRVV